MDSSSNDMQLPVDLKLGLLFFTTQRWLKLSKLVGMRPFPDLFNMKILLHSTKLQSKRKSNLAVAGGALFGGFPAMDIHCRDL